MCQEIWDDLKTINYTDYDEKKNRRRLKKLFWHFSTACAVAIVYILTTLAVYSSGKTSIAINNSPILFSGATIYCMTPTDDEEFIQDWSEGCYIACDGVWDCSQKVCDLRYTINSSTEIVISPVITDDYTCQNDKNESWKDTSGYSIILGLMIASCIMSVGILVVSFYTFRYLKKSTSLHRFIALFLWIFFRIPYFLLISNFYVYLPDTKPADRPPITDTWANPIFYTLTILDFLSFLAEIIISHLTKKYKPIAMIGEQNTNHNNSVPNNNPSPINNKPNNDPKLNNKDKKISLDNEEE